MLLKKSSFNELYKDLMSMDNPIGFLVKCASNTGQGNPNIMQPINSYLGFLDTAKGWADEFEGDATMAAAARASDPVTKRRILMSHPAVAKEYQTQLAKRIAEREAASIDPTARVREVGIQGAEQASREFGRTIGKVLGIGAANKVRELYDKKSKAERAFVRKKILAKLMKEDPIISGAEKQKVIEAYATMTKTAPILSTDINIVRSFLRDAVQFEGGISYSTIADLSRAEAVVYGTKKLETSTRGTESGPGPRT